MEKIKKRIRALRSWIDKVKKNKHINLYFQSKHLKTAIKGLINPNDVTELKTRLKELSTEKHREIRKFKSEMLSKKLERLRKLTGNDIRKLNKKF